MFAFSVFLLFILSLNLVLWRIFLNLTKKLFGSGCHTPLMLMVLLFAEGSKEGGFCEVKASLQNQNQTKTPKKQKVQMSNLRVWFLCYIIPEI